jgi:hypothetical protein
MGFRGSRVQIPPSRFAPRVSGGKSFRRSFANAARCARGFWSNPAVASSIPLERPFWAGPLTQFEGKDAPVLRSRCDVSVARRCSRCGMSKPSRDHQARSCAAKRGLLLVGGDAIASSAGLSGCSLPARLHGSRSNWLDVDRERRHSVGPCRTDGAWRKWGHIREQGRGLLAR